MDAADQAQGYVLSAVFMHPDLRVLCSRLHLEFAKGACWHQTISPRNVNWLLERTVDTGINGVSFGPHSLSDLDFADDVALLAKLLELLVPALETMAP